MHRLGLREKKAVTERMSVFSTTWEQLLHRGKEKGDATGGEGGEEFSNEGEYL